MPATGEGAWRGSPPKLTLSRAQAQPQDLAPAVMESTPCWAVRGAAGVGAWVCRRFPGPVPPPSGLGFQHRHEAAHARGGGGSLVNGFNPPPCLGSLSSAAEPEAQGLSSHYLFLSGDWEGTGNRPLVGGKPSVCS